MRHSVLGIVALPLLLTACSSGRLSDADIARLCDLTSRCTGLSEETCEANARETRLQAHEDGCDAQLAASARCFIRADMCVPSPECEDENERLRACQDSTPPTTDGGIVIVLDSGGPVTASEVRLSELGAIEIYHDGTWRPICDDGFGMEEAVVACRHLGYSSAAGYSTVTGPTSEFWLDDVSCTGSELSLDECAHGGWGVHNCSAGETQAVECF